MADEKRNFGVLRFTLRSSVTVSADSDGAKFLQGSIRARDVSAVTASFLRIACGFLVIRAVF
jgi:hypothetical protein